MSAAANAETDSTRQQRRQRQPSLLRRCMPFLGIPLLLLWLGSLRMRWSNVKALQRGREVAGPVIYAFWHDSLLYFACSHRGRGVRTLISRHADGQLIARTIELLGFRTARGSSTRGGAAALRQMIQHGLEGEEDLALTPDGPKGPRHQLQAGIVQLAARTGIPVMPVAVRYQHCKELSSWDRFKVPRPFTRGVVHFGDPFVTNPERNGNDDLLQAERRRLQDAMAKAEQELATQFEEFYRNGARSLKKFDPKRRDP